MKNKLKECCKDKSNLVARVKGFNILSVTCKKCGYIKNANELKYK